MPFLLAGRFRRWIVYALVLIFYSLANEEEQIGAVIGWESGARRIQGNSAGVGGTGFLIHRVRDVDIQALLVGN